MTEPSPTRFLLACDTLPSNPWSRDRLPAIRQAAADRHLDVIDIYEFDSREAAHRIHRETREKYFTGASVDLEALNAALLSRIRAYEPDVLILGTVDCYSRFLLPETVHSNTWETRARLAPAMLRPAVPRKVRRSIGPGFDILLLSDSADWQPPLSPDPPTGRAASAAPP